MAAIKGYRELSDNDLSSINSVKELEQAIAKLHNQLKELQGIDQRDLALARTHFEDGCIRAVRAIARPVSPWE